MAVNETKSRRQQRTKGCTWTTDTKEIAEPVSSGGLDIADLGLAEHAAWEAERTFNT